MKKIIGILTVLILLAACTNNQVSVTTTPDSEKWTVEKVISSIDYDVLKEVAYILTECEYYYEYENTYCGYQNDYIEYDYSWADQKVYLDGNESYISDLDIEKVINDTNPFPVYRKYCSDIKSYSIEGYGGAWCECNKLNAEAYYIDINQAFEGIDKDMEMRYVPQKELGAVTSLNQKAIGIKFSDTSLYKLLESGVKFEAYPSCYMYMVAKGDYIDGYSLYFYTIDNQEIGIDVAEYEDIIYVSFYTPLNNVLLPIAYVLK